MRKLVAVTFVTLDGIMQDLAAPARMTVVVSKAVDGRSITGMTQ